MTVHTTLRIYAIMFTNFEAVDQYRITLHLNQRVVYLPKKTKCAHMLHISMFIFSPNRQ